MKLILASNSPRRKELLSKLEYPFEIIPSGVEENSAATDPTQLVQELARLKASDVFAKRPDCVVLGCDTVVDFNGEVMGKPKDHADASRMLHALSGNKHYVHTGVCILSPVGEWLFCDSTEVVFRNLSEEEIDNYIANGEADGKAGAYGIQDDSHFAERFNGDFDNVVGLPVYRVKEILDKIFKNKV